MAEDVQNTTDNQVQDNITPEAPEPPKGWRPVAHPLRNTCIFIALIGIAIGVCCYIWGINPFTVGEKTTENAYVRGYTTVISPQVSGYVQKVAVQDFDKVQEKQPLITIDTATYQASLDANKAQVAAAQSALDNATQTIASAQASAAASKATIASAKADVDKASQDFHRYQQLIKQHAIAQVDYDHARITLEQAKAALAQAQADYQVALEKIKSAEVNKEQLKAQRQEAEAALAQAQIDLRHTTVRAPRAGQLSTVGVKQGQYVTAGTTLMYLVPKSVWVIANFKETDIAKMAIGQKAVIRVDALKGKQFNGKVAQISPATGSEYSVIANNKATGNFVKIVQRIPVKIDLIAGQADAERLAPGMSVEATVYTR